ncbi:MAG: methyl-accepting chemotaxis protein [Prolixibacteraceae bacterium]
MSTNRNHILITLSIGLVAPILMFIFSKLLLAQWAGINIPVHAVFEALGFFASIVLAIILIQKIESKENTFFFVAIGSGLFAIGILDGFHALTSPGNTFVWLHSMAMLLGGFIFSLILFSKNRKPIQKKWKWPVIVSIISVLIGVYSMLYPASLPKMTSGGMFTQTSNLINIFGGCFFILAAIGFMIRLWNNKNMLEIMLAIFCLLLGTSGLIFPLGEIWTFEWWNWHFMRLAAYFILLGYVMYLFNDSVKKMSALSEDLKKRNADINIIFSEIDESIGILTSSSSEIMAITTQLASGSAQNATSISETSTTVEEVKQTAIVSNHKAKDVSDKALIMAEISREGNLIISNTIEGMRKIKIQMNSIATMVQKLSEQSLTIGEITASVTELSEQSNLLSVNAAIEAAKAGEQGKGFTVVAQEIKLLANRSKEATSQVRTILREVQKSISSAVMATEEGSKAVEEGMAFTKQSGKVINTLAESVEDASNAAMQIAASSQQQLEGMDQMATAIESIREASFQSVTSTKQTVDSVNNLQEVGGKLKDLVKLYKLVK